MLLAALFVASYLLGAVPFGVLIARSQGADLTKIGSGNIGATNVKRALGAKWALLVFVLDVMKGLAPTIAARAIDDRPWMWYLVGASAVIGHCASPFLRFKGGKGVATSLGMVAGASPLVAAAGFAVFIAVLLTTRYVSLASMVAVVASVATALILRDWTYAVVGSILLLFVIYTHRANIQRLRNGTENKFKFRDDKGDDGGAAKVVPGPVGPSPRGGAIAHEPPSGGGE